MAKIYAHISFFYEVRWKDNIKIRKILIVFVYYFFQKRENLVFFCSFAIFLKSTKRDKILGMVCLEWKTNSKKLIRVQSKPIVSPWVFAASDYSIWIC